jgi:hypothetical protein
MRENEHRIPARGTARFGDINNVKVSVYYSKGGINYATYKQEQRGIWCSFSPTRIEDRGNGITSESFTLFSGIKFFVETAIRLNRKRVAAVFEGILLDLKRRDGKAWHVLNDFLANSGITLLLDENTIPAKVPAEFIEARREAPPLDLSSPVPPTA